MNAVLVEMAKGLHLFTGFLNEASTVIAELIGGGSILTTPHGRQNLMVDLIRVLIKGDSESI